LLILRRRWRAAPLTLRHRARPPPEGGPQCAPPPEGPCHPTSRQAATRRRAAVERHGGEGGPWWRGRAARSWSGEEREVS